MVAAPGSLRIVFFGTPDFAVPALRALLASRHTVIGVVTQPDKPQGRGHRPQPPPVKALAVAHGIPVQQPERLREEPFLAWLRALGAELGVVAAYGKILTEAVLDAPPRGLVNVHASLLPRYRGAAPIHRAILAGETETGVTIMRIVKALDAGPMLRQVAHSIGENETSVEVERALAALGAAALVETVDRLSRGDVVEAPQDEAAATYASKLQKSDGLLDWTAPAAAIHNRIRGLHPWPHAYSDLRGQRCLLLESRLEAPRSETGGDARPGAIVEAQGDTLRVRTGVGTIRLLRLQLEGRRAMTAREFLAGRPLAPGVDRFGPSPAGR